MRHEKKNQQPGFNNTQQLIIKIIILKTSKRTKQLTEVRQFFAKTKEKSFYFYILSKSKNSRSLDATGGWTIKESSPTVRAYWPFHVPLRYPASLKK